jgi:hypothetical protein
MRNWPYAYGLSEGEDSAVAGKFDATSLPGAEAGMSAATLGGWQVGVSKYSQNPEAAAKLAMWLASTEEAEGTGIEPELADPDQGQSLRGCRHRRQSSVHAQAAAGLHERSSSPHRRRVPRSTTRCPTSFSPMWPTC